MSNICLRFAFFLLSIAAVASADNLVDVNNYRALVGDNKAWRVGDNLTVQIVENAAASSTTNTSAGKDGSVGFSLNATNTRKSGTAGLKEDFEGGGRIDRGGKFIAQITSTVTKIEPNGDLLIKGDQQMKINNEMQRITIEGRVRPQDVAFDNSVVSTRVGNALIAYEGEGVLAEKQKPGILTRFLSWLGIL
jgi:flagellar L-ring protein precursor FlgH